jgi:hypothetical protein
LVGGLRPLFNKNREATNMELKGKEMKVNAFTLTKEQFDHLGDMEKDEYLYFMARFNDLKNKMVSLEEEVGLYKKYDKELRPSMLDLFSSAAQTIKEDQADAIKRLMRLVNDAKRREKASGHADHILADHI